MPRSAAAAEPPVVIDDEVVREALGKPKFFQESAERTAVPGVATGLAVTGVGGYVLRKLEVPLVPIILALLLGNLMEENLRRALNISNGDWSILISSPLTLILWGLVIAMLGLSVFFELRHARRRREEASAAD